MTDYYGMGFRMDLKKNTAILVAVMMMAVCVLPLAKSVDASGSYFIGGGNHAQATGSEIEIYTIDDLLKIGTGVLDPKTGHSYTMDESYILMADLDFTDHGAGDSMRITPIKSTDTATSTISGFKVEIKNGTDDYKAAEGLTLRMNGDDTAPTKTGSDGVAKFTTAYTNGTPYSLFITDNSKTIMAAVYSPTGSNSDIMYTYSDGIAPIGAGATFTGTFNGNGYTITGLNIISVDDTAGGQAGLFAKVEASAPGLGIVQNLGIVGGSFISVGPGAAAGSITAVLGNGGNIKNCFSTAAVVAFYDGTTPSAVFAGGLAGMSDGSGSNTIDLSYSAGSAVAIYLAPAGAPAAPSNFTAKTGTGNGQVVLTWVTSDNGGIQITSYQYSIDGGAAWTNIPSSGASTVTYTVTGLTGGNDYTFKIHAVNKDGTEGASSTATATAALTAPRAPDAPNLNVTPGNGQATLTWTAPNNGGSPITEYQYSQDGGEWKGISSSGTLTTCTVTGLTNGTTYTFEVRAVNSAGKEGISSGAQPVTPALMMVPSKPDNFTATSGNGQVTLRWTTPNDNGSPITGYIYSIDGGTTWTDIPSSGALTVTYTVTELVNGTDYTFEVRAVSAAGEGVGSSDTAKPAPLGAYAGGIIAVTDQTTVTGSFNSGQVRAHALRGDSYAGGITGFIPNTSNVVASSYNSGLVRASTDHSSYAGGIVGYAADRTEVYSTYNLGLIYSVTTTNDTTGVYKTFAGGIAGSAYEIYNSFSRAAIDARGGGANSPLAYLAFAGGITGECRSSVYNCYVSITYSQIGPTATIQAGGTGGLIGTTGEAGIGNTYFVVNCYYIGDGNHHPVGGNIADLEVYDDGGRVFGDLGAALSRTEVQLRSSSNYGGETTVGGWTASGDRTGDVLVGANFNQTSGDTYTLSVPTNPTNGTISWSLDGVNYTQITSSTSVANRTVDAGSIVYLRANPSSNYAFSYWMYTIDDTINTPITMVDNTNPLKITMDGNISIGTASFVSTTSNNSYTLSPGSILGTGEIEWSLDDTNWSALTTPLTVAANADVHLRAVDGALFEFSEWTRDLSGGTTPAVIKIDGNKTVGATFLPSTSGNQYSLSPDVIGDGYLMYSKDGINYLMFNGTETFDEGNTIYVKAVANGGNAFSRWNGTIFGNTNPAKIVMPGSATVIGAVFVSTAPGDSYVIYPGTVLGNGEIQWSINGSPYTPLTVPLVVEFDAVSPVQVELKAVSTDPNFLFSGWMGDLSGNAPTQTVTITAADGKTYDGWWDIPSTTGTGFARWLNTDDSTVFYGLPYLEGIIPGQIHIVQQPQNQLVSSDTQSATLSVIAFSDLPLTYQWQYSSNPSSDSGWTNISGATASTYSLDISSTSTSRYYRCQIGINTNPAWYSNFRYQYTEPVSVSTYTGEINTIADLANIWMNPSGNYVQKADLDFTNVDKNGGFDIIVTPSISADKSNISFDVSVGSTNVAASGMTIWFSGAPSSVAAQIIPPTGIVQFSNPAVAGAYTIIIAGVWQGTSVAVYFDIDTSAALNQMTKNSNGNFNPIGTPDNPFTGTYDGQGHKIIGLATAAYSNNWDGDGASAYSGLFGYMTGTVKNVILEGGSSVAVSNFPIGANNSTAYAGGIAGYAEDAVITGCSNSGKVIALSLYGVNTGKNTSSAGGIIGSADKSLSLDMCSATGDVLALSFGSSTATVASGGLVGSMGSDAGTDRNVSNCFFTGSASYVSDASTFSGGSGGIAGIGSDALILNCYSTGSIMGTIKGGIAGSMNGGRILNCYFLGNSSDPLAGTARTTYIVDAEGGWTDTPNPRTTLQPNSESGGKTALQLKNQSTYFSGTTSDGTKDITGWDFSGDIWFMGSDGPVLKVAVPPSDNGGGGSGGLNVLLIAGIVVAIIVVALAGFLLLRRR